LSAMQYCGAGSGYVLSKIICLSEGGSRSEIIPDPAQASDLVPDPKLL
jgi:hypothetical protein